jgi:hypothetical protein
MSESVPKAQPAMTFAELQRAYPKAAAQFAAYVGVAPLSRWLFVVEDNGNLVAVDDGLSVYRHDVTLPDVGWFGVER